MRYLFLLHTSGAVMPPYGTPEYDAQYAAYTAATSDMAAAGVLVDCAPLQPASSATTVPGAGRRDAADRRPGGRDQGAARRVRHRRLRRPRRGPPPRRHHPGGGRGVGRGPGHRDRGGPA